MPLDANIILQGRAPQFLNPMDLQKDAMTMKSLALQNQAQEKQINDQNTVRDVLRRNVITSADGKTTVDRGAALSDLYQVNPEKAMDYQKLFQGQDLDELKAHTQAAKDLAWSASPENYGQVRQKAIDLKLPNADKLPEQYSPEFVKRWQIGTLSGEEQIKNMQAQQENQIKQQNANSESKKVSMMGEYKIDGVKQKYADSLKKDLDPDAGRTGNFGQVSAKVLASDRLKTLVDSYKDGNLPPQQMEELALGLSNMLAGSGGASRSQVEALVPHTWTGQKANVQQWLLNEPTGADQQKFVQAMIHTVEREKETANNQLNTIREQRLSAHKQYAKMDPEGFRSQLQSYGLNPDDYDQNLLRKNKTAQPAQSMNKSATVQMMGPDGNIRAIPADQVDAAKAAGGKPL